MEKYNTVERPKKVAQRVLRYKGYEPVFLEIKKKYEVDGVGYDSYDEVREHYGIPSFSTAYKRMTRHAEGTNVVKNTGIYRFIYKDKEYEMDTLTDIKQLTGYSMYKLCSIVDKKLNQAAVSS